MSRRAWVLFAAVGIIWGLPYLLIKVGVTDLSPFVVVFLRVACGAALLIPLALARREFGSLRSKWRWAVLFGLVEITVPFLTLTWAETRISSSLAALLVAAVPLVAALAAWGFGVDDRLTRTRVIGLLIGLLGVVCLIGFHFDGGSLLAIAAVGVTVIGYATAPIIISTKLTGVSSEPIIAVALGVNTLIYAPFAALTWPRQPVPASVWWSLAVLGVVCTAIAFLLFFALIKAAGPARTTLITYVNPAVALILGVVILHEPLTWGLLVGFPLVLIGSYLATRRSLTVVDPDVATDIDIA